MLKNKKVLLFKPSGCGALLTIHSEKRHRKQEFDIFERVHEPDYKYMQRPVNPVNGKPIEPEHKLEVNIEQDNFTEEK